MFQSAIEEIVRIRGSRRRARRWGSDRLILNPESATESGFCLGALFGFMILQVWAIGEKMKLTSPWVGRIGALGLLTVLFCLWVRLILDDHYVLDARAKTITFRRRICWIPVWSEQVASFDKVDCLAVQGGTVDEHGKSWAYGLAAFRRDGVGLELLSIDKTLAFETAVELSQALSGLLECRIYPEPQAERRLLNLLHPHRLWEPGRDLAYEEVALEETPGEAGKPQA